MVLPCDISAISASSKVLGLRSVTATFLFWELSLYSISDFYHLQLGLLVYLNTLTYPLHWLYSFYLLIVKFLNVFLAILSSFVMFNLGGLLFSIACQIFHISFLWIGHLYGSFLWLGLSYQKKELTWWYIPG